MAKRFSIYLNDKEEALLNHVRELLNHERRVRHDTQLKNGVIGLKKYKPLSYSQVITKALQHCTFDRKEYLTGKLDEHSRLRDMYLEKLKILIDAEVSEPKSKRDYNEEEWA